MLVLSRKLGESIVLPGLNVTMTVLSVQGSAVRLGISAPPEIRIYREELLERDRGEARIAAGRGVGR